MICLSDYCAVGAAPCGRPLVFTEGGYLYGAPPMQNQKRLFRAMHENMILYEYLFIKPIKKPALEIRRIAAKISLTIPIS